MTFADLDAKLTGRCRESRKVGNHTYLKRRGPDAIDIELHATDVLTFHRDGAIDLCTGGFHTRTTHDRMNNFLPGGYHVGGEPVETQRNSGGMTVLRRTINDGTNPWTQTTLAECLVYNVAKILAGGTIEGGDVMPYRDERKAERNRRNRERARQTRWIAKARGLFFSRKNCRASDRYGCSSIGRWNRRNNMALAPGENEKTLACGCLVYRENAKVPKDLTVDKIMAEENAAVRAAMMSVYGTERFFIDANPKVVDVHGEYSLLGLPLGRWGSIQALKMRCPSTDAVYIQTVPPTVHNVSDALDWIFDTPNYLQSVTEQS